MMNATGVLLTTLVFASCAAAHADDCSKSDLACVGQRGLAAAAAACPARIERLNAYSTRWTDGATEPRFSRFNWTDVPGGPVTYIGDRVEFQTPQGAYVPMRYLCSMAADGESVVSARAYPGRLP